MTIPLSPREAEVLGLIAQGQTNKQIADTLCISPSTVKNHIRWILVKTDARTRTAAVTTAFRRGWITLQT